MNQQRWRDGFCVGLLLLLPLLLFAPVSIGNKALLPADALYLFEPFRSTVDVGAVQNPLLADLILQNYPWKQFLVERVTAGALPLWDPYLFSGHPFLANGQHSALYPLTWIHFLLPSARAFGVFTVLQLGLAGVSMYILARVLRTNRTGALLAGTVFELSGFMVVSVVHPMIIAGAAWLPLILACTECAITRRRFWHQERATLPWVLMGAASLGLQTLAGHAETTYFAVLVTGGYAAWRLIYMLRTRPCRAWWSEVGRPAIGLAIAVVIGLSLGAVQLIPFYEAVRDNFRQGAVTLSEVLGWAYPERRILTFLVPDFFGNPTDTSFADLFSGERIVADRNAYGDPVRSFDWGIKNYVEGGAYLGILPLLLIAMAVIRPPDLDVRRKPSEAGLLRRAWGGVRRWLRHPYVPVLTALSLFSLGCIFGTPLYGLVYALPYFNQSHSPFRWVFPLTVAASALVGLGVTSVAQHRETVDPRPTGDRTTTTIQADVPLTGQRGLGARLRRWLLWGADPGPVSLLAALAIWGAIAGAIALLVSSLAYERLAPLVERAFWTLANAAYVFPDARTMYAYLVPQVARFLGMLLAAGVVLRVSRCPIWLPRRLGNVPIWEILAILVVVVDLVAFGAGFNPAVDPALLETVPPVVTFLQKDAGPWRFSAFDPEGRATFNANSGMVYRFQDVRGYDSMFSAQYARYMDWIEPQGQLPYNRIAPFRELSSLDSPLTDMLNVKYVVSEVDIPLPKYRQVYHDEAVRVYENLGVAPRAFTLPVEATILVGDSGTLKQTLLSYDPRFYVVLEADGEGWAGPPPTMTGAGSTPHAGAPLPQTITTYTPNEVRVDAVIDQASWLVLTDSFARGWKAFVRPIGGSSDEEVEVGIARVAGNFRGVRLEDSATVRFRYSPDSVKFGAFLSFLSAMVIVFLAGTWTWRLAYANRDEGSTVQRVAKNSIVPIVLNIFNRAVDFAFAALMLRILGPANNGDYVYAISIFLWFDILTNFGLNTYLTREVARHPDQARRYLLNTSVIRVGLSLAGIPLLLGLIGARQTLVAMLTAPASRQAIIAMLLLYAGSIPTSISTGLTALFYAHEKAEYPAAVSSISTLVKVTFQTPVLIVGWGIIGIAGSSIVINCVTLTILGVLAWRHFPSLGKGDRAVDSGLRIRDPQERALRREMMGESWPLMVNHLLSVLFYKIDLPLMEPILGSEALGLYSIGYKLVDAVMVVPSMFTMALFPVISRQARDDRDDLLRFYRLGTKILVLIVLPVALIATVAGREMVLILGGPEYLPGATIALQWIAWSMPIGWINSITQYVLIAADRQRVLTRAYAVGFAFSLIANLVLMPRFGYRASAILHIASEALLLILFSAELRREFGTIGWREILAKPLIAAAGTAVGMALLSVLSRGAALAWVLIAYPTLILLLGAIAADERAMLRPLFQRLGR